MKPTEFHKINGRTETRYVLESASVGGTSSGAVASVSSPLGKVRKRDNILAQEEDKDPCWKNYKQLGTKKKNGRTVPNCVPVSEDQDQSDHEIAMASSELASVIEDATRLLAIIQRYSEMEGLEAWQQSKITKAADYLNAVLNNLQGKELFSNEDHSGFEKGWGAASYNTYARSNHGRGVAETNFNEIDYSSNLDDSSFPRDKLFKMAKVDGKIEGIDVMTVSAGNQHVYFLTDNGEITAFIGFENGYLKNIKNFSKTPGTVRALLGYLVHIKGQELHISPDEPLTPDGLKWITHLIKSPRGLTIVNQKNNPIDVNELKQEWARARSSGVSGPTSITISENSVFGNKLRTNESKRNTQSFIMPHNFYFNANDVCRVCGQTPCNCTSVTMESAPPGFPEDLMMKLKKQYPGQPERAFATAWSIHKKKKSVSESSLEELQNEFEFVFNPKRMQVFVYPKGANTSTMDDVIAWIGLDYAGKTPDGDRMYASSDTMVQPKYQRRGIATAMYQYLRQQGVNIVSSDEQTDKGAAMWRGFRKKGLAKDNKFLEYEYLEQLESELAEKLMPTDSIDTWKDTFQQADPEQYHQFKNKNPEKKDQMATSAYYASRQPVKTKK
jgi:GNAT superfamily N-acetyltransferase